MSPLLRKELRLLAPAWIAALLAAAAPGLLGFAVFIGLKYVVFSFGLLMLGLSPFGQEINSGTLTMLMAQPGSRRRIWKIKAGLLALAMISVLVVLGISQRICLAYTAEPYTEAFWKIMLTASLMTAAAFAGGLWTTVAFRQVTLAFWMTLLVPITLFLLPVIFLAVVKNTSLASEDFMENVFIIVIILYSVAGFLWARWRFINGEDLAWTGGNISLFESKGFAKSSSFDRRSHPWLAMLRKEWQLQQMTLLLAIVLLVLHMTAIFVEKMFPHQKEMSAGIGAFWVFAPIIVGCVSLAEERKLNMLESQLCLPLSRRAQFFIKFLVVVALGIFLGFVMPLALTAIGEKIGVKSALGPVHHDFYWKFLFLVIGLAVVSFYASTLASNTLQAMGIALGLMMACGIFMVIFSVVAVHLGGWSDRLIGDLAWPIMTIMAVALAYANFQKPRAEARMWRANAVSLAVALGLVAVLAAGIYSRCWELFMETEPHHGAPRITEAGQPKICVTTTGIGILLPDGRLWTWQSHPAGGSTNLLSWWKEALGIQSDLWGSGIGRGKFMSSTNWVDVASSWNGAVGIQSDGSLWQILSGLRPKMKGTDEALPQRIGTDSDWKSLASGNNFVLALKQDGSLWESGVNGFGQRVQTLALSSRFIRVGRDHDWSEVFAPRGVCIGVKRDGSVWEWGNVYFKPDGKERSWNNLTLTDAMRWNLEGTNWLSITPGWRFTMALRDDGSLWATGEVPGELFGHTWSGNPKAAPVRIESESGWREMRSDYGEMLAIEKSGALWIQRADGAPARKLSRYHDWLAADSIYQWTMALAADGTLSTWQTREYPNSFLGLSRQPEWSVNIFQ